MKTVIVYLIFCAAWHETVCTQPKEMPNAQVCDFVGRNMADLARKAANGSEMETSGKYRCLTVHQ